MNIAQKILETVNELNLVLPNVPECFNYKKDTGECKIGCKDGGMKVDVSKGDICPWDGKPSKKAEICPCYRK